jgi:hypothetical protein
MTGVSDGPDGQLVVSRIRIADDPAQPGWVSTRPFVAIEVPIFDSHVQKDSFSIPCDQKWPRSA